VKGELRAWEEVQVQVVAPRRVRLGLPVLYGTGGQGRSSV